MTIGNTLFAALASRSFSRLQSDIGNLQERISAGTQDPRPSTDLARSIRLSAAVEQRAALDRFAANATTAADRLAHADLTLSDVSTYTRELKDIVLQMGNASLTDEGRAGLRIEAEALRDALLSAANRTDGLGQGLFSGYGTEAAFVEKGGKVVFAGNDGQTVAQLSESMRLPTGLGGSEVFMSVKTAGGVRSLFDIADDLVAALTPPISRASVTASANDSATLSIAAVRGEATLRFTLSGPLGSAGIEQVLPGSVEDAINAASSLTGISASADGTGALLLTARGWIEVSGFSRSDETPAVLASFTDAAGTVKPLAAERFHASKLTVALDDAVSHMAEQRARAGSLAATVDRQKETITARQTRMAQAVAGLEDLDVAAAVTRLQSLLLTQEAAQQTYVKIANRSLFDYLR
ncbi:flagellar hook-associated protein FlgL [Cereibacter sphaeroides]|uniref:flagellar hook-associated protein FlgL n=1 Tax=Cereibacter sphaeroides TaxID=1063 RepID=UPI001F1621A6|nr:flagellar hook-associated protein FlgL [Cereibacter sphaeroides]MCE6953004.1 flagellar hook-associated protein FlgL [Cereibacter sphaeroides]